ncbi:MAG: multicopper oxidase family protein [Hyphomicrobiaceae bacterium]
MMRKRSTHSVVAASRRDVLVGTAATLALGPLGSSLAQAAPPQTLTAAPGEARLHPDASRITKVWSYNAGTPGPVLRARRGERIDVRLANMLPQPTTVHWHGIRIDNAMDGVPHLTQHAVEPGAGFDYSFVVPDAGTFWYHPHERSYEQVARGLTGALVVEEETPPDYDRDLVLFLSDWRLKKDGSLDERFGTPHDRAHAGRLGNVITVTGKPDPDLPIARNERIRIRIVNAASARIFRLRFEGLNARLIAIDGQPVAPTSGYDEGLTLAPGNRADLIVDGLGEPGTVFPIVDLRGKRAEIARLVVSEAEPVRATPLASPIELAPNGLMMPELSQAKLVDLVMTGGAKNETDMSIMSKGDKIWALNGKSGMDETPLFTLKRNQSVAVRLRNETAWPHGMHFHGHHFRIIARGDGKPVSDYLWDTVLMEPKDDVTIAFAGDNPGRWMIHCHMLDHQPVGMDTWFEVAG